MPFIKEVEETDKSFISNIQISIIPFYLVHIKHSAIEIRYASINIFKVLIMLWRVKSIMEKVDEEAFIEFIKEAVFAFLLASPL